MERQISILLLAALIVMLCCHASAQVVVIANEKIQANEVSKADLRDIFTGASSGFKGASQVAPVLLKDGPTHQEMLTLYIGKSDSAFRATWRSVVFSGQGVMPKSLDSEAGVLEYVAHTAGAVGYISKSTPHEGVKTLAVR